MEFDYALGHTVLRLRFQKIRTSDALAHTVETTFEGTAEVVTEADPGARRTIDIPDRSRAATTTSRLVLASDRRLTAVEAGATGKGPAWLKAGAGIAGTLVGAVVSFVNPVVGVGLAAASAGTLRSPVKGFGESLTGTDGTAAEPQEDPRLVAYAVEHPLEKGQLVSFRAARATLLEQLASQAATADARTVLDLSRRLAIVNSQLVPLEAGFAVWLASQRKREVLDVTVVDLGVEDLPSDRAFTDYFRALAARGPHAGPRDDDPAWARWAFRSGLGVSAEWPDPAAPAGAHHDSHPITVAFREGTTARFTTWSVTRRLVAGKKDGGGNEQPERQEFDLVATEVRRLRVVRADAPVRVLRLEVDAWHSGSLKVAFNDLGEPSEIGGTGENLAVDAAAGLPGAVKDGLATGSDIAGSLVPGSALEAALTREVALAKARADLLPDPPAAAPTPAEQALATLKAEVELAELQARLRLAQTASGAGAVIVRQL
jgi:hypothetical protein